jgi:hypothetical protein
MAGRECHHCKQWIEAEQDHDCWTTTEVALTRGLSDDLREAWARLRETASAFGEQRIYASHNSIMFSRKSCYFFVRPKRSYLEVCIFLPRRIQAPQVHRVEPASKSKLVHFIRIIHRDEVEAPITDWLSEAYALSSTSATAGRNSASDELLSNPEPTRKLDDGSQVARVRRICASIPGTTEKVSHGEPTFFTPKRVFAMFANNHHGDGHIAVWLPAAPGVQQSLIEEAPEAYFRPPYVGASGWVGVEISRVDDEQLGALIREAFRVITAKSQAVDRPNRRRLTKAEQATRRTPGRRKAP